MPWQQWFRDEGVFQRNLLQGGIALLSLRPGHWKGRCCAEGDPRKDRQVQKDLVKGGEGSQERWPVAHLKSMVLAISSLDYIYETLVLFNQGVGPQKKSDASCN